jgi:hypothetical protein
MTEPKGIRPQDVLPDEVDNTLMDNVQVRKGTVAAFVANAKLLETLPPDAPDRPAVEAQLRALVPGVRAVGVFDVLAPRSPAIAALIDAARVDHQATTHAITPGKRA